MSAFTIAPLGERAWVCAASPPVTAAHQARVWALAALARGWPGVTDAVPGMNNLTVFFNPLAAGASALRERLREACEMAVAAPPAPRTIELAVSYGGADGPDLAEVARHAHLSADDVVARHAQAEYLAYFVGFQPGFAYLGGLDPALAMPRRATPRLAVPRGSVAIGGAHTGVYPARSPGGWHLIGITRAVLFDAARDPPSLIMPGDRVRFRILRSAAPAS